MVVGTLIVSPTTIRTKIATMNGERLQNTSLTTSGNARIMRLQNIKETIYAKEPMTSHGILSGGMSLLKLSPFTHVATVVMVSITICIMKFSSMLGIFTFANSSFDDALLDAHSTF